MEENINRGNYVEYSIAKSSVLIEALHNKRLKGEFFVEELVKEVASEASCSYILSRVSRLEADLNRAPNGSNNKALKEHREVIGKILSENSFSSGAELSNNFLHLSIHGMKDRNDKDIEIGTRNGRLASSETTKWFAQALEKQFPSLNITWDKEFLGGDSLEIYRYGDQDFTALGDKYNVFQIEISYTLRKFYFEELVKGLTEIILEFTQMTFND